MDEKRKLVKKSYNQCAQDYSSKRDLFKSQRYLADLVKQLPDGGRVLDLGCGSGVPVDQYLAEHGFSITGIDISEEQIKLAQKNFPQGDYRVADMNGIDFNASSFDAVVSFYAIFHIPREEHLPLLKKLYTFTRPNGYLLITMGTSDWEGTEEDFHGAKMFWSHYDREKNIELVKEAGYKIINETVDTSGDEYHLVIFAKK